MFSRPARLSSSLRPSRSQERQQRVKVQRRKMLFEGLEDRSLMAIAVANPGFEANAAAFTVFPGYLSPQTAGNPAAITGWTGAGNGLGINPSGGSPFANNGVIPQGTAVAFIQGNNSLSQTVTGLVSGVEYTLSVRYNSRISGDFPFLTVNIDGSPIYRVQNVQPVGGANPYRTLEVPFTATGATALIQFASQATSGGDATVLLDDVRITPRVSVAIANASFEANTFPTWPGYTSQGGNGAITSWSETPALSAGINPVTSGSPLAPFSPFNGNNGAAPAGTKFAFMQVNGTTKSLSQTISGLIPGATYRLTYFGAHRQDGLDGATLSASINASMVDPAWQPSRLNWTQRQVNFVAPAASATLQFTANNPVANDQTIDIDGIALSLVLAPNTTYVEDTAWSALTPGAFIPDADFGTAGDQPAIFGVTAFSSVQVAINETPASGTIIVNGGTYAEAVVLSGTQTLEITGPDAAQTVIINSLATAVGQNVILEGASNLTIGDATSTTIAGVISGTGSLTKVGSGTLSLNNFNTFTGGTTVNAGTLMLGAGGAVGTVRATLTVNAGATVNYTAANTFGFNAGQSVNVLNINGGTVGGANFGQHFWNNFALNMTAGTLHLGGTLNEWHNPTITTTASATSAQILPVTGAAVFRMRDNTSPLFNVADGAAADDLVLSVPLVQQLTSDITKAGAGLMRYNAASSTFRRIYVSGGALSVSGSGTHAVSNLLPGAAIADGARATGNGVLNIEGSVVFNSSGISINNQSGTIGTINQSGTSDVNVTGNVLIGHWSGGTGNYNISGGTLDLTGNPGAQVNQGGAAEQSGVIYLGIDGTGNLTVTGGAVTATAIVLDGRGNTAGTDTLTLNSGSITLGNNANATTIAQSGIFSGNNNGNASYQINLGGGTLRAGTAGWNSSRLMTLTNLVGPVTVDTNGQNIGLTGVLSGTGSLIKQGGGVLTLVALNTYTGSTTINAGALNATQMANGGLSSSIGQSTNAAANLVLNGGTLRYTSAAAGNSDRAFTLGAAHGGIDVAGAGPLTISGNVVGNNRFTKSGAGTLSLTPAAAAISNLYAVGGNLTLAGSGVFSISGNVLPGASTGDGAQFTGSGTLNIQGSVTVNVTGEISINNQGSTTGTVNQSGTSDVNVANMVRIGHWPGGGVAAYNISGGTLDLTGNPGAQVNQGGAAEQSGVIYLGIDGSGNFTVTGGAVTATAIVLDGRGNTAPVDTFTLNGGTVTLGNAANATTIAQSGIFSGNNNGNTSYLISMGGGTLRAATGVNWSTSRLMTLTNAVGPVVIDTNGQNIGLTGVLSGGGTLTKIGLGDLTLTAMNTYTGATNVNAGRMVLNNAGGNAIADGAGLVTVAAGAELQLLTDETVSAYLGLDGPGEADGLLNLGGNTLTTTGSATIANVTSANGAIIAGTAIIDGDADNNITGTGIYLQAGTAVGTLADPIESTISNLEGNAGTGFFVANAGNLAIGGVTALNEGVFASGDIVISTAGRLTVNESVTATGVGSDVTLTTIDAAGVGQDLVVSAGATVSSAAASVTLNAGDNATITGNVSSGTTTTINVDATSGGVADAGVGGSLTITGVVTTPTVGAGGGAFLNGFTDNDTFTFNPQTTTEFRLFGDSPVGTLTGDTLIMDVSGTTNPNLTVPGTLAPYNGLGSGVWSFTSAHRPVLFGSIEQSTITGNYHVTFDNSVAAVANLIVMRDSALPSANVQLRDGSTGGPIVYQGTMSTMLSLRILGSAGNDTVTIDDINTLPNFSSTVPGVTDNANLPGTAELLFDGLGGDDTLVFNINGTTASQTYAIGNGTGAAGLEGEVQSIAASVTLQTYFQNVELVQRTGIGASPGGLTIIGDASDNEFSTAANGALTRTSISGYTPFEFSGNNYDTLTIDALGGADLLDLVSLGSDQTNNPAIFLNGGTGDDTLRVRSTSGNTGLVSLIGGAGNDLFLLYDGGNTVDNIVGPVDVDGTDGNVGGNNDTLTIIDSGDLTSDSVVIAAVNPGASQDYYVDGINTAVGHDVVFRNIDVLNYTSTAADDQIDGRFESTVPAHDLNIVNLSGWTGADQFHLYTSDQIGGTGAFNTPTGLATGIANINLYGDAPGNPNAGDGNDIFGITPPGMSGTGAMDVGLVVADSVRMIRPSFSTAITIDGGRPTGLAAPLGDVTGDVLNVDISALPNATSVIVSTFGPGTVVASGISPLVWSEIEDINLVDQGKLTNVQMGDLFARTTPGPDLVQITRNPTTLNPHRVRLRITATIGNYSASNKTIVYGGAGNDTITQANLTIPAEFYGEDGDDYLSGAMNNDWLVGGLGNDRINGSGGDNIIWGDNAPTLPSDPNPQDSVAGGDDILSALGGNDVFYGGGGNDQISAGGGDDYAYGGEGNDVIDGHDGDDRLYGGNGDDVIHGGAGNDLLSGGDGDDRLYGNTGNDMLIGGFGSDLLDGGDGNDLLISGRVANESSSWTSVPNTTTFSAATYTLPSDNDAALLTLLTQWGSAGNRTSLTAITHDGDNDDLWGGTGDDDFCWETADILDNFPGLTPPDFNAPGMGTDERFGPT